MLTTAITGAIAAVLALFGIKPGPYLAVVWIVIKLLMVLGLWSLLSKFFNRNKTSTVATTAPIVATESPTETL
jgi:hypothetical protein